MFLVCGEALYDFFLPKDEKKNGDTEKVDQINGNTSGAVTFDARPGGSPYNVSIGMSRLGASSALLTGLSNDMLGTLLNRVLKTEGVSPDYLIRTSRQTTLSLVGVDESGGPSYAFYGKGSADTSLTEADLPMIGADISGLHFGSFSIAVNPVADAFAALAAREKDRFISLDPNVRPTIEPDMAVWRARIDALRPFTNLLKVSDEDLSMLYPDTDPVDVVRSWSKDGPAMVVLTRGGSEAVAHRAGEEFRVVPPKTEVIDTVGAGDTFMASLLADLTAGEDPAKHLTEMPSASVETLINRAATAAAITCERRGADLPTADDLAARLA